HQIDVHTLRFYKALCRTGQRKNRDQKKRQKMFYWNHLTNSAYLKNFSSKAFGRSSRIWIVSVLPARFVIITGTSPQSSQMIWRHEPHGGVSRSVSATTAIRLKFRLPSETALNIATRSAQSVRPYVEVSILHPAMISPSSDSTAEPTRKPEYSANAFSRAAAAAFTNGSSLIFSAIMLKPSRLQAFRERGCTKIRCRCRSARLRELSRPRCVSTVRQIRDASAERFCNIAQ